MWNARLTRRNCKTEDRTILPKPFEIGDANLTIESANAFEAGMKRGIGDFRFDLSDDDTGFTNFVYKRYTGATCSGGFETCLPPTDQNFNPLDPNQVVYSQAQHHFVGAEVMTEYDIAKVWRGVWGVQGQYDFVHATFEDGSYVPKIPPHRLGGGFYYYDRNLLAAYGAAGRHRSKGIRHLRYADGGIQPAECRGQIHDEAGQAGRFDPGNESACAVKIF